MPLTTESPNKETRCLKITGSGLERHTNIIAFIHKIQL